MFSLAITNRTTSIKIFGLITKQDRMEVQKDQHHHHLSCQALVVQEQVEVEESL